MIKGQRLKELREKYGMSADDLAAELKMAKAQLLRYENEKNDVTSGILLRIAKYFDVSTDYLLGLSDNPVSSFRGELSVDEVTLLTAWRKGDFKEAVTILFESFRDESWKDPFGDGSFKVEDDLDISTPPEP